MSSCLELMGSKRKEHDARPVFRKIKPRLSGHSGSGPSVQSIEVTEVPYCFHELRANNHH